MNRFLLLCCAAITTVLTSCSSVGNNGAFTTVVNPTVDELASMEAQWGLAPRTIKNRARYSDGSVAPSTPIAPAPAPAAPAPASAAPAPAAAQTAPAPAAVPDSLR